MRSELSNTVVVSAQTSIRYEWNQVYHSFRAWKKYLQVADPRATLDLFRFPLETNPLQAKAQYDDGLCPVFRP
jgi:hypothetical protein